MSLPSYLIRMHGCVKVIKYEKDAVKQSDLQNAKDIAGRRNDSYVSFVTANASLYRDKGAKRRRAYMLNGRQIENDETTALLQSTLKLLLKYGAIRMLDVALHCENVDVSLSVS
jgi:hypothetical protein